MSTIPAAPTASRPRFVFAGLAGYFAALAAALITGNRWLDVLAVLVLTTLLLSPLLRLRSAVAWAIWLVVAVSLGLLAVRGNGHVALDATPVLVNAALGALFGSTLARGRVPLIARVIEVIEGAERLALPRVAAYARGLTQAWTALFCVQAGVLAALAACVEPDGLFASVGATPPVHVGAGGRWYLHFGSYALVAAFMLAEYAFRRWHLRGIAHASLPVFLAQLARRWPALVRRFADDAAGSAR